MYVFVLKAACNNQIKSQLYVLILPLASTTSPSVSNLAEDVYIFCMFKIFHK